MASFHNSIRDGQFARRRSLSDSSYEKVAVMHELDEAASLMCRRRNDVRPAIASVQHRAEIVCRLKRSDG